ncbi:Chain length determinant protein [Polystyrenella longa]|uniref:Chain length determinant protein n=1 Tax=Polystyrenella longa TaxID=2528007 RepID=A0A518CQ16_9PLAN|nr:Wzz/FepE/Etk N-terminal domain-containing protein [Polystyrenella longa]QDU81305.1 Chain length determinant protein [Polystyrenella longa]
MNTEVTQSESLPILQYLLIGGKAVVSHWRTVLVVFIATFVLAQAIAMTLPRKYASDAKLFVKVGKESIGLDPTATTGSTISMYESREAEIRSLMEIITSRAVLERVVDKIGPEAVLGSLPSQNAHEKAITHLSEAISVERGTKSSVISMHIKESSPEQAQKLLTVFLEQFRELHIQANSTEGSYDFFVKQSQLIQEKYDVANKTLQNAKNSLGITSLLEKGKVLEAQETELQKDRQVTEATLATAEAEIRGYKQALTEVPERMKTLQRDHPNISMDPTIKLRDELLIQRQELLNKFTENHPRIKSLDDKIVEADKVLNESQAQRPELNEDNNPTYLRLMEKLKTSEATAIGLRARQARLETQFEELDAEQKKLNAHEGEIASLTKYTDVLLEKLYSYNSKKEEARINQELGNQDISNVNVFQAPTYVTKPVSPRKSLILILSFLLSLLNALMIPLLMEYTQFTGFLPEISLKDYSSRLAKTT